MQSALAIVQYETTIAGIKETEPRTSGPEADLGHADMIPEEANPDLSTTNNYVDNHVNHHVDHTVTDIVV